MARARRVVMQEVDEPAGALEESDAVADEEAAVIEADVLAGLRELEGAGSIRWDISRLSTEPGRNGFLVTWLTAQLTKESLRDHFGGGRYRIVGKNPNGTYAAMRTVEVADDAPVRGKTSRTVAADAPAAGPGQSVQDMIALMDARNEAAAEKRRDDLKFWATLLVPALVPVVGNLFGGKKEGINEMVAALANLKSLQGGEETKLESFVKMLEVAQNLNGGKGGGDTNWLDILKEGLGMARPALENLVTNAANRLPSLSAPPASSPFAASPAASPLLPSNSTTSPDGAPLSPSNSTASDPMLKLLPWLKHQLEFLIVKAARDADPGLYAELLIDNLPDGVPAEKVVELLSREDWWNVLSQFSPGVTPYVGWFTQLRAMIIEGINGPDETGRVQGPISDDGDEMP